MQILKTTKFHPSRNDIIYILLLNKPEKVIKKYKYIEKSV